MNTIETMLLEVSEILKEHKANIIKNDRDFNLFKITGIQSDEVKICRVLAEIIDPMGSHNKGVFFLRTFAENVLRIDMDEDEIATARVYVEYHTVADRRIDIAIVTNKRFIPIEVKIFAEDQNRQCKDYYEFANSQKKPEESKVYYLTLDGHLPQKGGTIGLTPIEHNNFLVGYEEIVAISFKRDICFWLESCLEEPEIEGKTLLRTNIEQFVFAIGELSGNMSRKLNADIAQLISADSDKFAAASIIAENVQEAKKNKLFDLFNFLDAKLKLNNFPYEQIRNRFDFRYNNNEAVERFYNRGKTWPSLTYRCKKIDEDREIWFRIEVEHNLYCGFVVAENGDNPGKLVLTYEEIERHINVSNGFCEDSWWFYWEYLLNDNEKSTPNFVNTNETMIKLFDREYFEKFVDLCVTRIIELTKEMKLK